MSHIVRGQVKLAYTDEEVLRKALATIGVVLENQRATIATGVGYKQNGENYPIVLEATANKDFRIGFKREANGAFVPYYDNFGELGKWCAQANAALTDRYIAYHYEKQLISEGYNVELQTQSDGSIEVLASEVAW